MSRLQREDHRPALREALVCTAAIDKRWTIASFSRLTRDLSSQPVLQAALHMAPPRPADDEPLQEDAAMPVASSASLSPWHGFTRGPSAGNFLHDQLEWLAADGFALQAGTPTAERLLKRCERAGFKAQADAVARMFRAIRAEKA